MKTYIVKLYAHNNSIDPISTATVKAESIVEVLEKVGPGIKETGLMDHLVSCTIEEVK